jgi:hypothetical protein
MLQYIAISSYELANDCRGGDCCRIIATFDKKTMLRCSSCARAFCNLTAQNGLSRSLLSLCFAKQQIYGRSPSSIKFAASYK